MNESFAEKVSRLHQMAEDDGDTWDLSDNDRAAISAVLSALESLPKPNAVALSPASATSVVATNALSFSRSLLPEAEIRTLIETWRSQSAFHTRLRAELIEDANGRQDIASHRQEIYAFTFRQCADELSTVLVRQTAADPASTVRDIRNPSK